MSEERVGEEASVAQNPTIIAEATGLPWLMVSAPPATKPTPATVNIFIRALLTMAQSVSGEPADASATTSGQPPSEAPAVVQRHMKRTNMDASSLPGYRPGDVRNVVVVIDAVCKCEPWTPRCGWHGGPGRHAGIA